MIKKRHSGKQQKQRHQICWDQRKSHDNQGLTVKFIISRPLICQETLPPHNMFMSDLIYYNNIIAISLKELGHGSHKGNGNKQL